MASEKITAILDEIKGLSILELKELIDTYCERVRRFCRCRCPCRCWRCLLQKRRRSSTLCWPKWAPTRWPLSRR